MTIKELEERTGLDRATIRFYEKEGLISPRRMANGYRDYTPAEAPALEKIALLRRLGLSMEQIRRVQTGELPPCWLWSADKRAWIFRRPSGSWTISSPRAVVG